MTSRVPPIWLLALLLVAICIIYVLSPSDSDQAENLQAVASSEVEKAQAESHVAVDHSAKAIGSRAPRAQSKEASREQVGSTLRTFGLQTLDPIRWRAAKNTKIFYTTDALLRAEPEKFQDFYPGNPWAHEDLSFLPSVTTDEHGNAVFRVPGDVGYFYCSYENTRGMLKLTMKGLNSPEVSNDRVIRLHQADVVEVQVSRANGKPAIGVPLKFYRSGTEWVDRGRWQGVPVVSSRRRQGGFQRDWSIRIAFTLFEERSLFPQRFTRPDWLPNPALRIGRSANHAR